MSVVDQLPSHGVHSSRFFSACFSVHKQPFHDVPSYSFSSGSAWFLAYPPPCNSASHSRRTWFGDNQPPSHDFPLYSETSRCTWSGDDQPTFHDVILYLYPSESTLSGDD